MIIRVIIVIMNYIDRIVVYLGLLLDNILIEVFNLVNFSCFSSDYFSCFSSDYFSCFFLYLYLFMYLFTDLIILVIIFLGISVCIS
jgi:hypothetical protein